MFNEKPDNAVTDTETDEDYLLGRLDRLTDGGCIGTEFSVACYAIDADFIQELAEYIASKKEENG